MREGHEGCYLIVLLDDSLVVHIPTNKCLLFLKDKVACKLDLMEVVWRGFFFFFWVRTYGEDLIL